MGGEMLARSVIDAISTDAGMRDRACLVLMGKTGSRLDEHGWGETILSFGLEVDCTIRLPTHWTAEQADDTPHIRARLPSQTGRGAAAHQTRCIVHKVVHPLSEGAKRLGERISVSLSGNSGVRARSKYSRRWRHIGSRRIRAMKKLDESKARWIIAQKRKGMTNARIAETMCISVRWVKKISARYSTIDADKIVYPMPMGRPRDSMPGRREHSAVLTARRENHVGAVRLHRRIEESTGMNIPYNRIHRILRDEDLASEQPKKSKRRKWIRFERTYSNSMWHTDYKQLDNGRWFLCYEDDASRFVTGYGVFEHATTENALAVLEEAIKNHGKPASIMTDRGSQFYANASEAKKKGVSEFEKRLVSLGIRQILAGVRHPQTNGKLERLHGELQAQAARVRGDNDAQE